MDRNAQPDIHRSEQGVLNRSFDEEFQLLTVEALVYNTETGMMDRMTQPGVTVTPQYDSIVDVQTDYIYSGEALPGTLSSVAEWRISRTTKATLETRWADSVTTFTKIWDSRTGYTY
jgi:hypothetical protein